MYRHGAREHVSRILLQDSRLMPHHCTTALQLYPQHTHPFNSSAWHLHVLAATSLPMCSDCCL